MIKLLLFLSAGMAMMLGQAYASGTVAAAAEGEGVGVGKTQVA